MLCQQRKSPSNERQTEFDSPELRRKHKNTAFSVRYLFNSKRMNQEECLRIVGASTRVRIYVMVRQAKSPCETKT